MDHLACINFPKLFILFACCVYLPSASAQQENIFVLRSLEDAALFDKNYLYLQKQDQNSIHTIATIRSEAYENRFVKYHPDSIHCKRCVYWGKFYLKNALEDPNLFKNWVLRFNDASYIDVFIFDSAGNQRFHGKTGKLVPAKEQTISSGFKFNRVKFSLKDTSVATIYFRYQRTRGYSPGFDQLALIPNDDLAIPAGMDNLLNDRLFFGFLLTAFLFNFLFFVATKDRAFLYQTLFLLGVLVFIFESAGLTNDSSFFRDHPKAIMPVSYAAVALLSVAYIQFIRSFGNLKNVLPGWDKIARLLIAANIFNLPIILIIYFSTGNEYFCDRVFVSFLAVQYLVLAWLIFLLTRKKEPNTYFLAGAVVIVFIGVFMSGLNVFSGKGIQTAFLKWILGGNITLFFLGLAYRMKKLEKEEQEAIHLKELNELKNRLFTHITHEFRTPLTVIDGMAAQIGSFSKVAGEHTVQKAVQLIQSNGNRLLNLVNRMLDLAKLESGRMELTLHRNDVVAHLRSVVESFEAYAAGKNILLQFLTELPSFEMDYDQDKLQQIVANLISNALKFTPEGGKIFISVKRLKRSDKEVLQMECTDTGEGIPPGELPFIFSRFYQAENSKKKGEGTGIGLALTQELVKLMGGTIDVKSTVGVGTTFTVQIPAIKMASTPKGALSANAAKANIPFETLYADEAVTNKEMKLVLGHPNSAKPLVLIVEDHADVIYYLRTLLEDQYELETAHNGRIGIEYAIETIPDIIISDVMMPDKDGFELCETLKNDQRTSHIPIILLTAKTAYADRIAGLKRGADAYLTKPFRKEELLVCLENIIQAKKRLLERYSRQLIQSPTEGAGMNLEDAFIGKLQEEVKKNMQDEHFGIPQLCRSMKLSRTQLHRKISTLTGKSTSHFIRSIRLFRAKELLHTSEFNISEIAFEVGFSDPNYFTRMFTAEFGVTPTIFRQQ